MEFVGRTVKKDFKGFGVFAGTVRSYDASSGLYEIVYAGGDSEELDYSQLASVFQAKQGEEEEASQDLAQEKPRLGRKPKKRRRVERKHEVRGGSGNNASVNFVTDLNNGFGGNLSEIVDRKSVV